MTTPSSRQPIKDTLIGCGGAILTSSLVIVPALVAAYYIIWEPLK